MTKKLNPDDKRHSLTKRVDYVERILCNLSKVAKLVKENRKSNKT